MTDDKAAVRGRGRPRRQTLDATSREAAWALIADGGYAALTLEAVAALAGCARATLYRRFPSKEVLLTTILEESARSVEPSDIAIMTLREALIAHAHACLTQVSGNQGRAHQA